MDEREREKAGRAFSTSSVLLAAVAAAWLALQTSCEGKQRRFVDLEELESSSLTGSGEEPGAASIDPPDSTAIGNREGQRVVPEVHDGGELLGPAATGADDVCADGEDAGSCPPLPLCSGDAGTACIATCLGCLIEAECVASDTIAPHNSCLICNPERDRQGWSPNDGVSCDDELFCTIDDVCREGICGGIPRDCEDGVACNGISTCEEEAGGCSPDENQCGTNALCDAETDSCVSTCTGCVIDGVCVAAGTEAAGNPCLVCDPTRSRTAFFLRSARTAARGQAPALIRTAAMRWGSANLTIAPRTRRAETRPRTSAIYRTRVMVTAFARCVW